MTPYELGILLHYYASAIDPPEDKIDMRASIWRPTIDRFIDLFLIERDRTEGAMRSWRLTDKGRCYVEDGLCNVPLPEPTWRIPHVCPAE